MFTFIFKDLQNPNSLNIWHEKIYTTKEVSVVIRHDHGRLFRLICSL